MQDEGEERPAPGLVALSVLETMAYAALRSKLKSRLDGSGEAISGQVLLGLESHSAGLGLPAADAFDNRNDSERDRRAGVEQGAEGEQDGEGGDRAELGAQVMSAVMEKGGHLPVSVSVAALGKRRVASVGDDEQEMRGRGGVGMEFEVGSNSSCAAAKRQRMRCCKVREGHTHAHTRTHVHTHTSTPKHTHTHTIHTHVHAMTKKGKIKCFFVKASA